MPGEGPVLGRRTVGLLLAWGLSVWAGVALTIRLVGHSLLSPGAPIVVVGFFVATVPLMLLVTYPIYRRMAIAAAERARAAAVMSVPGMFLDVLLVGFAEQLLPNLSPGAVVNFGAILLFGYAIVLLTGLVEPTVRR